MLAYYLLVVNMLGIYIHIPFCKKKCNYCDFVSYDCSNLSNDYVDRYLGALSKEVSKSLLSTWNLSRFFRDFPVSTIYIGGGTPSILSCRQIEFLFSTLYKSIAPNKCSPRTNVRMNVFDEITFECNPESIDEEKLEVLKSFGVNRLSFGVQSFDDEDLKYLGRIHSSDEFYKKYELARLAGFNNISIDLIYGLPNQKNENWRKNLEKAISLRPNHISVYPLTIEENTIFFNDGVKTSDEVQEDMFNYAREFLHKKNYNHYEISNFALPSFESKHNLNYWRCGEYLGFGVAAASHFNNKRWNNTDNLEKYISNSMTVKENEETIDEPLQIKEKIIFGLRMVKEGVDLTESIMKKYGEKINQISNDGLVEISGRKMKITNDYIYVSNQIMREFV